MLTAKWGKENQASFTTFSINIDNHQLWNPIILRSAGNCRPHLSGTMFYKSNQLQRIAEETPNETFSLAGIIMVGIIWGGFKLLILSSFLTPAPVNSRGHSSRSSRSIILWLNTVISRSANEITSFHWAVAVDHRWSPLRLKVELHSEGLKIVNSVTKHSAFSI